jgi:hypothetical protein
MCYEIFFALCLPVYVSSTQFNWLTPVYPDICWWIDNNLAVLWTVLKIEILLNYRIQQSSYNFQFCQQAQVIACTVHTQRGILHTPVKNARSIVGASPVQNTSCYCNGGMASASQESERRVRQLADPEAPGGMKRSARFKVAVYWNVGWVRSTPATHPYSLRGFEANQTKQL